MPKVIGIAGFSGSGKTTLVEALAREFAGRGLAVATMKHAPQVGEPDGKDTARHRAAGAFGTLAVSDDGLRLSLPPGRHPAAPAALARRFFPDADVVLVEGFKREAHPKLWVLSAGESRPPGNVPHVAALVAPHTGPAETPTGRPLFLPSETARLADFLLGPLFPDLPPPEAECLVDGAPLPMKGFVREMMANVCRGLVAALKLPGGAVEFSRLDIVVRGARPPAETGGHRL